MRGLWRIGWLELRMAAGGGVLLGWFASCFAVAFLFVAWAIGALPGASRELETSAELVNSPSELASLVALFSSLGMLMAARLAATAASRDFESRTHGLLFTAPIAERGYLLGRASAAVLASSLALCSVGLGAWLATLLPGADLARVGPASLAGYVLPYAVFVFPNAVICTALVLPLVAVTRSRFAHYAVLACLFGCQVLALLGGVDADWVDVAGFLDPTGYAALSAETRHWSLAQRNGDLAGVAPMTLAGRALWLVLALLWSWGWARRFRFEHACAAVPRDRPAALEQVEAARPASALAARSPGGALRAAVQLRELWWRALCEVALNRYLAVLCGVGLLLACCGSLWLGSVGGPAVWPVTYHVLESRVLFGDLLVVMVIFYGGELLWTERQLAVAELVDSTPLSRGVLYAARLGALLAVLAAFQLAVLLLGVSLQMAIGQTPIDWTQYLVVLFGFEFLELALLAVLALAVHTLLDHKQRGALALFLVFLWGAVLSRYLGFDSALVRYAYPQLGRYSDMNGYGPELPSYLWFHVYWAAVASLLGLLTHLFWVRGCDASARERCRAALQRCSRVHRWGVLAASMLALGAGGYAQYGPELARTAQAVPGDAAEVRAEYEQRYGKYSSVAQPRVVHAALQVDLYPERGEARARGVYRLRNQSAEPISELYVTAPLQVRVDELEVDAVLHSEERDAERGFFRFHLNQPIAPGSELELRYALVHRPVGFAAQAQNFDVVANGSLVQGSRLLPEVGYASGRELTQAQERLRHGLPQARRRPASGDLGERSRSIHSSYADWVSLEATVSTTSDQIAIAPGVLEREWNAQGRRYFLYRSRTPVLLRAAFLSARYEVLRENWGSVPIELYYHPGHTYNLERMLAGARAALAYCSREFGPYPFSELRVAEFPRYGDFGFALAGTVPVSESAGFLARVRPGDPDQPFQILAHEVGHQWWAHQLAAADAQGAPVLSEGLATYVTFAALEEAEGPQAAQQMRRHELEAYLSGRGRAREAEEPLLHAWSQRHVSESKGALALYALREYLGAAVLHGVLRDLMEHHRFRGPPYPTTQDLLARLRQVVPPELRTLLSDLFERIALHENKLRAASAQPLGGGRYAVQLEIEVHKRYADELGAETEAQPDEPLEIGVFDAGGEALYLQRHRLKAGSQKLRIEVGGRPARAGVDPRQLLIERSPADNSGSVEVED